MSARLDLVYNPASGNFRQGRLDALVRALAEQGFEPRLVATTPEGVAIAQDAELVCIHGGDGTVRMVAEALGERIGSVPLCIAPVGTINLLARELGYAADPHRFARQLEQAWKRGPETWLASPVVTCGTLPVLACLSLGPDSVAVAGVSGVLKSRLGRFAYLVAALKHFVRWPSCTFLVNATLADGTQVEARAGAAFIARGRFYAGPFRLSRAARLGSETAELVLLNRAGRLDVLLFTLAVMFGLCPKRAGVAHIHSVRKVSFSGCTFPVQVDGDAVSPGSLTVEMSGQTVRFCV